ncbi:MAG: DUF4271 domain-containing protein [Bacteroidetes bacterium]|nr:DUF4271 domain-containing protein [Bacteroidota bacterium]
MIQTELYTALYTFIALFFVLIRLGYAEPFYYFKRVLIDDTFIRLYEKGLKRWRNSLILLTVTSALVYAVFLTQLSEIRTVLSFNFLTASIAVSALLFLKMGVRKALAFAHSDTAFFEMAQVYALTYFAYEALMVFALGVLLSIYPEQRLLFEYVLVSVILTLQTKCYYGVIKHLLQRKSERLVLFIFYLCALEIAPVVVVYTLSI